MFGWCRSVAARVSKPGDDALVPEEQSSPGMARALQRILARAEQPEILDLGQLCGSAAVYLAGRGARVSVEDFPLPESASAPSPGSDGCPADEGALRIHQPDRKFDLILAWEHLDFVAPARLGLFAAELRRVLAPDGWLLFFAEDGPPGETVREARPSSYRITADDRVVRWPTAGQLRPRFRHPSRAIERALAPLAVQSVHLQRNRVREFLLHKPVV